MNNWEEKFEDICGYSGKVIPYTTKCTDEYNLYNTNLSILLKKYIGHDEVIKIKV